ncbi:MAG: DUF4623 domain-containing protein [Fimbriimonadaceae bacterium]
MKFLARFGAFAPVLLLSGLAVANVTATMAPKTSFGNNGWIAPNTTLDWLTTDNSVRGLAFNPVTGNLLVVARNAVSGNGVRILDGQTGAQLGQMSNGTGVVSGGTFVVNMIGVSEDGQIFVANLTTNTSTSPFRIYHWTSEADTPTVAYSGNPTTGGGRLGDTIAVRGSGNNVEVAAGYGNNPSGFNGYALFTGGSTLTGSSLSFTGPVNGAFRLGITFGAGNSVWGKQTNQPFVGTSFDGGGSVLGNVAATTNGEGPITFARINGVDVLASIDVNSSVVRLYDVTDINNVSLLASLTTTTGTLASNGNGVGALAFGNISGANATLYAMSTNQGIQAFDVTVVPEPATMTALALGALALMRRRRKS